MKLWVDDIRPAPEGYVSVKSVNRARDIILNSECMFACSGGTQIYRIEEISIDHDAGDYVNDGGDYIKLLDWLEDTGRNYPIHIHSMNPVGVQNMRTIIERNGWKEV